MNRNIIIISLLVIVIAAISISFSGKEETGVNTPSPTPLVSPSGSVSGTPTTSISKTASPAFPTPNPQNGIVQTPVPRGLITGPASCQLEGKIVFQSPTTYITEGAKMKFQNVDDSARLIYWAYTPNDGAFTAGPNIFANIKNLPSGELTVGATWQPNKEATVKSYQLKAVITYGIYDNKGIETGTAQSNCTGSVTVTTP